MQPFCNPEVAIAVPWWETSGAFALYGAVAGGAITGSVTVLSNRHAANLAATDRLSRSEEADRSRKHDLAIDALRAARTTRERVYPQIAAAAQEAAMTLSSISMTSPKGTSRLPSGPSITPSDVRRGRKWSSFWFRRSG